MPGESIVVKTRKIQVIETSAVQSPSGAFARSLPQPQTDQTEVGGRIREVSAIQCWNCSGLSWIDYDTNTYQYYVCCYCDKGMQI